jgi:putative SOS response-associated peptidase YedK
MGLSGARRRQGPAGHQHPQPRQPVLAQRAEPDRPRCVVPVTRFCEWEGEKGSKRKVWFGLHEEQRPLFAFAGLWRPGEGGVPYMAFLTCDPNAVVGAVHPKAMPVMLRPADVPTWLDSEAATACALAVPYADADMRRLP